MPFENLLLSFDVKTFLLVKTSLLKALSLRLTSKLLTAIVVNYIKTLRILF